MGAGGKREGLVREREGAGGQRSDLSEKSVVALSQLSATIIQAAKGDFFHG